MKTSQQQADELLAFWRKGREAGIPPQDRLSLAADLAVIRACIERK
jgi:hypothetical protein